jgi:(R)-amidase
MGPLNVLLAQLSPVPGDVEANLATVLRVLDEHPGVQLAVFPELFLQGYTLPGIDRIALDPDAEQVRRVRAAAADHGTAVVIGFAERSASAQPANSALCIDERGGLAGVYRKVHLFGAEQEYFTRGGCYPIVTLCGSRIAPLICYDIEFPEPARTVALAGAELLVTVSANMEPYLSEHELFARARAVENRMPHVYVNRVGAESGLTFVGGSCVVDPAGRVDAALGRTETLREVMVGPHAEVEPDYLAQRFPDVPAVVAPSPRPLHPARSGG